MPPPSTRHFRKLAVPPMRRCTAPEAREYYLNARFVSNPEPPRTGIGQPAFDPRTARHASGPHLHAEDAAQDQWFRAVPGILPRRRLGDRQSRFTRCGLPQLADQGELIVISVDYRLAPEHKFPAAADDAITATKWVAANAKQLGIDAAQLLVGGDSRRRQSRGRRGTCRSRRRRPKARRPGADLSCHRLCDEASLAQRA